MDQVNLILASSEATLGVIASIMYTISKRIFLFWTL